MNADNLTSRNQRNSSHPSQNSPQEDSIVSIQEVTIRQQQQQLASTSSTQQSEQTHQLLNERERRYQEDLRKQEIIQKGLNTWRYVFVGY